VTPQRVRDRLDAGIDGLGAGQDQHEAPAQATQPASRERIGRRGTERPNADPGLLGELDELSQDLS
jgi:hypothetical protein